MWGGGAEGGGGSGAEIVEGGVEGVYYFLEGFLPAEVGGAEEVGEVVVWMAGIEGGDKVGEGAAAGDLAERTEGAGP